MADRRVSHYQVQDRLGSGGMGVVFRAHDTKLGRDVALKFLSEEGLQDSLARDRFMREARAAAALNHPNICTVYEIGESEGEPYIAMELLEGATLTETIGRQRPKIEQVLEQAIEIADALAAAHSKGITHRDVKPGNIFITRSGHVKVLDFGLAKLAPKLQMAGAAAVTAGGGSDQLTSVGMALGTIAYMSPEQARGEELDARTDLFSFGTVMYEMATGAVAFTGNTSAVIFDNIMHGTPEPIVELNPELPRELERIINKSLEKDAEMRYQTASEIRTDLRRLQRDLSSGERKSAAARAAAVAQATFDESNDKSVAVLYFENSNGTKEDEYFRDGITEDVITELSKIDQLRVFPRSEMLAFRDKSVAAPAVGQQLNAAYVLEGSIRRAGDRLRITAQLVESRTRHSIWAERYDRKLEDIFAIQDEIARSIAQALRIRISPQEESKITQKPTENLQAYDYYLRGRSYMRRFNLDFALQMFEQAIKLDPKFALAHAGKARACSLLYEWQGKKPEWLERARTACDEAAKLKPELPEVLVAQARIFYAQDKYEAVIPLVRRAIALSPDCDGAYDTLARGLFAAGKYQEASDIADAAVDAGGDDYNVYVPLSLCKRMVGDLAGEQKIVQRHITALRQQLELVPEDVRARILLAANYAGMKEEAEAIRHLQTAVALRPNDSQILFNAACTYGQLGRKQDALETLKQSLTAGYRNHSWITRDPDLKCLHGDPEFHALIDQYRPADGD